MKTHQVLDLHYHEDEGQGCFDGTKQECEDFAATQTPDFMYKVVPMTKEEIENHPDNVVIRKQFVKNTTVKPGDTIEFQDCCNDVNSKPLKGKVEYKDQLGLITIVDGTQYELRKLINIKKVF